MWNHPGIKRWKTRNMMDTFHSRLFVYLERNCPFITFVGMLLGPKRRLEQNVTHSLLPDLFLLLRQKWSATVLVQYLQHELFSQLQEWSRERFPILHGLVLIWRRTTYPYKILPSLKIAGIGKQKKVSFLAFMHRWTTGWPIFIYLTIFTWLLGTDYLNRSYCSSLLSAVMLFWFMN